MHGMERTQTIRTLVAAALMALTLTLFAGAATADDYDTPPPSSSSVPSAPKAVKAAKVTRDDPLPVTGSDVAGLAAIGGGLVLVGGGVLLARRRNA